ncbi:MAG: hypothetical protein LC792_24810, partial [Actinobacteria bacterium]|nr:hypothetical protein [Actinomycetota bacterium]
FRHPLTEEVAYRTQLGERRARLHRAVAEAITELQSDRLDELAALIAHHWEAAGEALQAAQWTARAANWAGFNDPIQATQHWRRVRSLTAKLEPSAPVIELGITAALMIMVMGWRLGGSRRPDGRFFEDEAVEIFTDARKLAEGRGEDALMANLVNAFGTVRGLTGHIEEFVTLTMESVVIADRVGDPGLRVALRAGTAYPLLISGRLAESLGLIEEGLALTGGDRTVGAGIAYACPHATLLFLRGLLLGSLGRSAEAFADLEESLQIGREVNDLDVQGWVQFGWPWVTFWCGGPPDTALMHARRAVEIVERTGGGFSRVVGYALLAEAYLLNQQWAEAETACTQSLAIMHGSHIGFEWEPIVHSQLARTYLGVGRVSDAVAAAQTGVRLSQERRAVLAEVQARHALAEALLAEGPPETSAIRQQLDTALELIRRTGFAGFEPKIHACLKELALI